MPRSPTRKIDTPEKSTGSPRAGQGPRSVAWVPRSLHSVHTRSSLPSLSALTSSSRSGTEAMNWAIRSAMAARPANRGKGDPPMCGGASTRHSRTPSGAKHPAHAAASWSFHASK